MIDLSNFKQLIVDSKKIIQLFIDDILVWRAYKNWVHYSINADGSIYNDGIGYKDGYRVRSGGAEGAAAGASCTGFIPVKAGDVIRISGCNFGDGTANRSALNVSDSSFTNLGQFTMLPAHYGIFATGAAYQAYDYTSVVEESEGAWKWIVPPAASGVAYIRVTGNVSALSTMSGSGMIVTINEEII